MVFIIIADDGKGSAICQLVLRIAMDPHDKNLRADQEAGIQPFAEDVLEIDPTPHRPASHPEPSAQDQAPV